MAGAAHGDLSEEAGPDPAGPGATPTETGVTSAGFQPAPGSKAPARRSRFFYELLGCGLHGHFLVGTDAADFGPEHSILARRGPNGLRWHRCLRCDTWMPVGEPEPPRTSTPPPTSEIELPMRGKPLRDRYVLRIIAVDRAVHVVVLSILTVAIFVFATHRNVLHHDFTRILADLQGGLGGPVNDTKSGIVSELNKLFALSVTKLYVIGVVLAAYTAVLALEMVGLWRARRWAEYLTLAEVSVLVPFEIYELTRSVSYLKILTLVINLAVVAYLLVAHRLFGLRGGVAVERAQYQRDSGWPAIERATPPL